MGRDYLILLYHAKTFFMTPKTFSRFRTRKILVWALLFSLFTISLTDCNQKPGQLQTRSLTAEQTDTSKLLDWITMDIKFKVNTNAESRDMAIRAVEGIIMDTIKIMAQQYSGFFPVFTVSKGAVTDTLNYRLLVDFPSTRSPLHDSIIRSVGPPPCTNPCRNMCGVCATVMYIAPFRIDTQGPYALIDTITAPDYAP
jgi:hypothetical protein